MIKLFLAGPDSRTALHEVSLDETAGQSRPRKEKEVSVRIRPVLICSVICMMLVAGAHMSAAQQVRPLEPEWLRQMHGEGWEKVQEGVLRRDTGGGKFETFSYGAEGLRWVVQGYQKHLTSLEERYLASPSQELADVLFQLREHIDQLNADLRNASSFESEALPGCTFTYDADAYADAMQSPQGVTASASATWYNTCGYRGSTFAYAFANAISGTTQTTVTQTDPPVFDQRTQMESYAAASASGSSDCRSEARAEVRVPALSIVYQTPLEQHSGCPLNIKASITGPTSMATDFYSTDCASVTWTARAIRGNPEPNGYAYKWYIGTALQGLGDTLTKQYCNVGKMVTVKVVATDSIGWSDSATFTTDIDYRGPVVADIDGPASVATYSSTPCADVTWTASATSSGHSGFTYSWYLGSGTIAQGTGSTFTKRYCSTTTSPTVKVVARASDGHTDSATFTTDIVYHPSLPVASISGPAIVQISTFGECVNISWTAGATGGAPGYTYTWYIGTSTTVQGTGSTLTKTFCGAQTINVKVTARDSAAQTDDALFTTTVERAPYNECGTNQICP